MLSEIINKMYENGSNLTPQPKNYGAAHRKDIAQSTKFRSGSHINTYTLHLPKINNF